MYSYYYNYILSSTILQCSCYTLHVLIIVITVKYALLQATNLILLLLFNSRCSITVGNLHKKGSYSNISHVWICLGFLSPCFHDVKSIFNEYSLGISFFFSHYLCFQIIPTMSPSLFIVCSLMRGKYWNSIDMLPGEKRLNHSNTKDSDLLLLLTLLQPDSVLQRSLFFREPDKYPKAHTAPLTDISSMPCGCSSNGVQEYHLVDSSTLRKHLLSTVLQEMLF